MVLDHALQHLLVRLTHGIPGERKTQSPFALNRACDYLKAHYHEGIGLEELGPSPALIFSGLITNSVQRLGCCPKPG
ncbi:hypothetical protein BG74_07855, partial [Sodalis-like endosymbiont of Proechinophthirus fluctus]|uniref:hypothetical protein n=1 Tax=Sodalis-like endosymbiont of Proechinophthirus fluctus TaxID=1462730 RepID=UPI0007A8F882